MFCMSLFTENDQEASITWTMNYLYPESWPKIGIFHKKILVSSNFDGHQHIFLPHFPASTSKRTFCMGYKDCSVRVWHAANIPKVFTLTIPFANMWHYAIFFIVIYFWLLQLFNLLVYGHVSSMHVFSIEVQKHGLRLYKNVNCLYHNWK